MPSEADSQHVYRLIQITDSHLGAETGHLLLGMDTDESLSRVVAAAAEEWPDVDLVLATGDISDDGSEASYSRFQKIVSALSAEQLWLCGNHDELPSLSKVCGQQPGSTGLKVLGNWQIIFLNSAIPGKVGGGFEQDQLDFLEQSLSANTDRYSLICLHHQPVEVGCFWLDKQIVNNAVDFFEIVDRFDNVRIIAWGHVHQKFETQCNHVSLMSTPSTCIQFKPNSFDFAVDLVAPGYRVIDLHPNGDVDTSVHRIDASGLNIDLAAPGY